MEDRLTLLTEFPIDNERLKREMAIAKKEIAGGGDAAVQATERVNENISKVVAQQNASFREREGIVERLRNRLKELNEEAAKATSVTGIEKANAEIQLLQKELDRLSKIGKVGFDDMGRAIPDYSRPTGQLERLNYLLNLYKRASVEATNPALLEKYNAKVQQTQIEITRLSNVGKQGFDAMGNAIQKNIVWNNGLVRGLSRTVEHIRRIAYIIPGLGISGLFFLAWEPLSKFVRQLWEARKNVDELAKSQQTLNKAFESNEYTKAVTAVNELRINLDLAKKGMADKKAVIDQYNESIGSAAGEVTTLSGVEQGLIDNADNYVKMMLYKAAATAALEEASKHAVAAAKALAQTDDEAVPFILSGTQGMVNANTGKTMHEQAAENARNRQAAAEQKHVDTMLTIAEKFQKDTAKIAGEMGGLFLRTTGANGKKDTEKILRDRQRLLEQLATLETEYLRKSLTKDQEELQALRNKFAKIRFEVERFNADPKNKHVQIDIAGLAAVEDRAVADLTYRQETDKLKTQLERQRELWQQYEEYKTATSAAHADERYADELDKIKSFRTELESEVSALVMKRITTGLTGGEAERLKALDGLLRGIEDKEQADRDARFKKAFEDYATYEQKRQKIIADSERIISEQREKGEHEQAENARKARDKNLAELTETYLKSQGDIGRLFEEFEKFGARGQRQMIDAARREFEAFKREAQLSAGELEMLNKLFDEYLDKLETAARGDLAGGIVGLGQELESIVQQIGRMDQGLGQALQTIGQMAQSYVKISEIVSQIGEGMRDSGKSGGNMWVTIIGAVVQLVGTIWTAIAEGGKRRKAAEKAAQEDLKNYQAQEIAGEREYQRLLRERELIAAQASKTSYQAIIAQLELLKSQAPEIERAYNRIFAALQGDEFIDDKGYRHGTWFRKAKTWDIMASLAGSDYERLEQLYLQGKLKDTAKADFEALRSLRDELEAVGLDVQDLQQQLAELLTGTTVDGLSDALMDLFQNGKMAAADLGKSFEEIMSNAIRQTFKQKYLVDAMQPLHEELARMMADGTPTEDEIERLRQHYERIGLEASEYWKELERITGQSLSNNDAPQGISGRINRTISETTASEILGFERARYDLHKRTLGNAEETLRVEKQIYDATIQALRHHAAIEQNTADTVTELRTAVVELKAINKNTKQSSTSYDRL